MVMMRDPSTYFFNGSKRNPKMNVDQFLFFFSLRRHSHFLHPLILLILLLLLRKLAARPFHWISNPPRKKCLIALPNAGPAPNRPPPGARRSGLRANRACTSRFRRSGTANAPSAAMLRKSAMGPPFRQPLVRSLKRKRDVREALDRGLEPRDAACS